MSQTVIRVAAVLLLTFVFTVPATAQTATLAKCQAVKDRTERYTDLRRKGGSATQMQQWKQQLRASEDRFRRLECKKHRRKLQ